MHCAGCLISRGAYHEQLAWLKRRQRELGASKRSDSLPVEFCWEHIIPKSNHCTHISFPAQLPFGFQKEKGSRTVITQAPSWSELGDGSSIWQEGVRMGCILFVLHQTSRLPGLPSLQPCFFSLLFVVFCFFQILIQSPWHSFVLCYSSGA